MYLFSLKKVSFYPFYSLSSQSLSIVLILQKASMFPIFVPLSIGLLPFSFLHLNVHLIIIHLPSFLQSFLPFLLSFHFLPYKKSCSFLKLLLIMHLLPIPKLFSFISPFLMIQLWHDPI
jgi:hypothetical protein